MRPEIVEAVRQMVQALVDGPVVIGSLPPLNGYAIGNAGGAPIETFRCMNTNEEMPLSFTGKNADQHHLADEMDKVLLALTTARALPSTAAWQVYAIETTSAPQLIGREENSNWIYGSSFRIRFFAKGASNG
ncbi:MAG: hypothetical protein DBX91_14070 [Subdoligranulum variabile]|uniref:hypothetical protein n=1 Tax=Gemmiger formicilis TaxID=745368 RepID=UPI000D78F680|nr:MAG: hypothetical protein DBX91_14070 [Subdoligranulum variabile]